MDEKQQQVLARFKVGEITMEECQAEMARLAPPAAAPTQPKLRLQVTQKGAVGLYGLRRFPVVFYRDEWTAIVNFMLQDGTQWEWTDEMQTLLSEHADELATRPGAAS